MIYDLRFYNQIGDRIGNLNAAIEFEYGRQKNDIGACSMLLPGDIYNDNIFHKDSILEIWRYDEATGNLSLVGKTIWLLRKIDRRLENGVKTIELLFYDTIDILRRRVIPWYAIEPEKAFIDDYPSTFYQPLDDMLKMIFFHNFGAGAIDPTLNTQAPVNSGGPVIPPSVNPLVRPENIGLQPYTSSAPVARVDFAWKTVLEAMKDVVSIAETFNVSLWFDIEYIPGSERNIGTLEFKTWTGLRGQSLTNLIFFGAAYGNLEKISFVEDYTNEATIIYATGEEDPQVDDGIAEILTVSVFNSAADSSGFFYPIEGVIPAEGDVAGKDLELLESQARVELSNRSPVLTITGDIVQHGFYFFRDYQYGDLISAVWEDINFPAEITKFNVAISNEGEKITIPIESSKFITTEVTT